MDESPQTASGRNRHRRRSKKRLRISPRRSAAGVMDDAKKDTVILVAGVQYGSQRVAVLRDWKTLQCQMRVR
jgi:hypothetical protein